MLVDLLAPAAFAMTVASKPCSAPPFPAVRVAVSRSAPTLDLSRTGQDLTAMNRGGFVPHGYENGMTRGLTNSGIGVSTRFSYSWSADAGRREACLWVTEVTVDVAVRAEIYIDRQYAKGSCAYDAILEHELKHVRVNEEAAQRAAALLKAAIERAVAAGSLVGPFPAHAVRSAQDRVSTPIRRAIDDATAQIVAEREQRQRAVDTPEEYRRVAQQCRGR